MKQNTPEIVYSQSECAAAEMACLLRKENTTKPKPIKMSAQLADMLASGDAPVVDAKSYVPNMIAQ